MKIVAAIASYNEDDIIESCCRYAASFCDYVFVWDSGSTDNTKNILNLLSKEGLPLIIVDKPFNGYNKRTTIADLCFSKLNADLVIPVDCDEFLFNIDGRNPKSILENLDLEKENRIFWRSYIYTEKPSDNTCFLPFYFFKYRHPDYETYQKTPLSRVLFNKYKCVWRDNACHRLTYLDESKQKAPICDIHEPLRYFEWVRRANGWH